VIPLPVTKPRRDENKVENLGQRDLMTLVKKGAKEKKSPFNTAIMEGSEQNAHALLALHSKGLDKCKRHMVKIFGKNWASDLRRTEQLPIRNADQLKRLILEVVYVRESAGVLVGPFLERLEFQSMEAGVRLPEFWGSLPKITQSKIKLFSAILSKLTFVNQLCL
jgi:hypothetical protein